jgi:DNA-binding beta-propeller fold protein YncE
MSASAPKLFICYRREETAAHAGRLYDALAAEFGDDNVFMDIELEPGVDFVELIKKVVGACHVLLVVMGPRWAALWNGEDQVRTTGHEEDFVRLELETAFRRRDVRVIPLLVGGASMPHAEDLPEAVRALTRRNAFELSDLRWRYDVGRLMNALEELLAVAHDARRPTSKPMEGATGPAAQGEPAPIVVADPTEAAPTERPAHSKRFARSEATAARPPPSGGPRSTRWKLLVAAGAAIALALGALAFAGVFGDADDGTGGRDDGGQGPQVSATVKVGGGPDGMAVDGGFLWVSDQDENVLRRVDTATNERVGAPIPVGQNPDGVAAEDGTVWVASLDAGTVTRLETSGDGTVTNTSTINLDGQPEGVALGKQLVWVTTGPTGAVARLDRASPTVLGEPIDIGLNAVGVFVGEDTVYVSDKAQNTVTRLDPATAETLGEPIRVGKRPRGLVEAEGSVWVANSDGDTVSRIDVASGRVVGSPIAVGKNPRDVTSAGGFVWVANTDSGTVTRIDARTGRVAGKAISVGEKPASITAGAGSVWVSNSGDGTLSRLEP